MLPEPLSKLLHLHLSKGQGPHPVLQLQQEEQQSLCVRLTAQGGEADVESTLSYKLQNFKFKISSSNLKFNLKFKLLPTWVAVSELT